MKKLIVIINGSGGTGKDEFVKICSEFKSVMNVSSIDHVKKAMEILCPSYTTGLEKMNGDIGEKWRANLHWLKEVSIEMDDGPYKIISQKINEFLSVDNTNEILFLHIREPKEITKIVNEFNALTLLITNKNVKKIDSNAADANVDSFDYNIYIDNSGSLEELREQARRFVEQYP